MGKKCLKLIMAGFIIFCPVFSGDGDTEFIPKGEPILKVFNNFHQSISKSPNETAFEIRRAYLGYKANLHEKFDAVVKLDIGSPDDESAYSRIRRYAYFKNAYLAYKPSEELTIYSGIIGMYSFDLQESFWGHRYLYKSFQDKHDFNASADVGIGAEYQVHPKISLDFTCSNGEGYAHMQLDNHFETAAGVTVELLEGMLARGYYDFTMKDIIESTFAGFMGYEFKEKAKIGVEYNLKMNRGFVQDRELHGLSAYGAYLFMEKFELFARHDRLYSNKLSGEEVPWNLYGDGTSIICGLQFAPFKKVKIALNYQDWYPMATNLDNQSFIYLNLAYQY